MQSIIEEKLGSLNPIHLEVVDFSDGCGLKFNINIVSKEFEGKSLVERHRLVHKQLDDEMKSIHALTLKTLTPTQWESQSK
ncbi:unnamed protein product [Trichobilharzia szidati]|nr:unnamed protein product [Trichobilharzia szidati]